MKKFIFSLVGLLCAVPAFAGDNGVSTTGTGTVYTKPDCAHVSFTALTENKTAAVAYKDNRALTDTLFKALTAHKIADTDVSTSNFNVQRNYDKEQKHIGFAVNHRINVTVRNVADLGSLIDDVVAAGCQLDGITFQVKNRAELEKQARDLAIADAKAKAEQLCKGLGAKLGNVKTIGEYNRNPYLESGMAYDMAPGTRVASGDRAVSVQVSVSWDIECSK